MNINVRNVVSISFSSIFLASILFARPTASAASGVELAPRSHTGTTLRVKTVVEVAGSLSIEDGQTEQSIPLKVHGELFFDERGLSGDTLPSVRHYWNAQADFEVDGKSTHRELRDERQIVLLSGETLIERYTSPLGPLERGEVELVDLAGSAFPVEQLLPSKPVEEKTEWAHSKEVIANLLRLDTVTDGDLVSSVTELRPEQVRIAISGDVIGAVNGVETQISLKGNYHFDRTKKIIKWIALAIKEKRDSGFAAPGFDVVARVRSARQWVPQSEALLERRIGRLDLAQSKNADLLEFVSPDKSYQMSLDRRWYAFSLRPESAIFRLVDDGDLLATCKIDQLGRGVPGKQVSLDGFRADVERALDKNCEQIVSVSETVSPQDIRVLRVVAAGKVSKTPIRWIYCHLSDDEGRRLSYIFTHEASLEDRLAGFDETLTSSAQFLSQAKRQAKAPTSTAR